MINVCNDIIIFFLRFFFYDLFLFRKIIILDLKCTNEYMNYCSKTLLNKKFKNNLNYKILYLYTDKSLYRIAFTFTFECFVARTPASRSSVPSNFTYKLSV